MGTIGPNDSRSIAKDVEALGASYIEAPVLGSQPEALKVRPRIYVRYIFDIYMIHIFHIYIRYHP